jgi:IPT/TIG domain/PASTA domain
MNRKRFATSIVAVVCGAVLALASSASAAIVNLGAPLSTTFGPGLCSTAGGCTISQFSLGGSSLPSSPVDGVILNWSIKGAGATPGYAIRVLNRSGLTFTGAGTSAPQTPAGAGIETFATNLPIKKGQYLGVNLPFGGAIGVAATPGAIYAYAAPAFADGASGTAVESVGEVAFNAQVQPVPTIAAITPTSGPLAGPTQVTITGTDFANVSAVKFGAAPATAYAVNSETQITAFTPAGTGAVPVTVTTIAGTATSPQSYTYTAPPIAPPPVAPTCKVPNLEGKRLKAAKKKIRARGCKVGHVGKEKGVTAKTGEVIKQHPEAGTIRPAGSKVGVKLG